MIQDTKSQGAVNDTALQSIDPEVESSAIRWVYRDEGVVMIGGSPTAGDLIGEAEAKLAAAFAYDPEFFNTMHLDSRVQNAPYLRKIIEMSNKQ